MSEAAGADAVELTLPEIRALLAERLKGRPTRANFRTGHLTICTLVPMRSVPTASSACSVSTTPPSRARPRATATT